MAFVVDIEKASVDNRYFRKVLFTSDREQLVVMSLLPKEDIGMETHPSTDQFIRVEEGTGDAILDGKRHKLASGSALVIPAGTKHNIVNTSSGSSLKLYTVYSPPHHKDGKIHKTKADAEADKNDKPSGVKESKLSSIVSECRAQLI